MINKRKAVGLKENNDSKAFLNNSTIWMVLIKIMKKVIVKRKTNVDCIWWYDSFMLSNKNLNLVVTEFFIRSRKINTFQKNKLNSTHYCIIHYTLLHTITVETNKSLQLKINHLSDTDYKHFINLYKIYTCIYFFFTVFDAALASDNLIRLKRNILERI